MHGDDDHNSSFPFLCKLFFCPFCFCFWQIFQGCLGLFFFWTIGLENIFSNLVSGGKGGAEMAKLGFEKDCNNINEDNSNNYYNSCVFVNGIIKVIFVCVVVCCITGPNSPPPTTCPLTALPCFFRLSAFLLSV